MPESFTPVAEQWYVMDRLAPTMAKAYVAGPFATRAECEADRRERNIADDCECWRDECGLMATIGQDPVRCPACERTEGQESGCPSDVGCPVRVEEPWPPISATPTDVGVQHGPALPTLSVILHPDARTRGGCTPDTWEVGYHVPGPDPLRGRGRQWVTFRSGATFGDACSMVERHASWSQYRPTSVAFGRYVDSPGGVPMLGLAPILAFSHPIWAPLVMIAAMVVLMVATYWATRSARPEVVSSRAILRESLRVEAVEASTSEDFCAVVNTWISLPGEPMPARVVDVSGVL